MHFGRSKRSLDTKRKLSRNAPCPCGSGRKYKRCCLDTDAAASTSAPPRRGSSTQAERSDPLIDMLMTHAVREYGEQFTGLVQTLTEGDRALSQIALPIALYEIPIAEGKTPARHFLAKRGASLGPAQRLALQASLDAYLSIWEVLTIEPGCGFEAVDLLTGRRTFIHEVSGTRGLGPRCGLLARVAELGDRCELDGLHPRPLAPAETDAVIAQIRGELDGRRRRYVTVEELDDPGIVLALFEAWHQHAQASLARSEQPGVLTNTDGEPFVTVLDHFTIVDAEADALADALLELPDTLACNERGTRGVLVCKRGNPLNPGWRRTILGAITIDRRLTLETNSVARADRLRARLEQLFGPRIRHESRACEERSAPSIGRTPQPKGGMEEPQATTTREARENGAIALDAQPMTGWMTPPTSALHEESMRHWQHRPCPKLDGLSPRAAAVQSKYRPRVHELLRALEYGPDDPERAEAIARTRAELGLDDMGHKRTINPAVRACGMGRKASAVLFDYAMPLLVESVDSIEAAAIMHAAAVVWNHADAPIDELTERAEQALVDAGLEDETSELDEWVEYLAPRRALWPDDRREFEIADISRADGMFYVEVASAIKPIEGTTKQSLVRAIRGTLHP
jgi:hypothetical protein